MPGRSLAGPPMKKNQVGTENAYSTEKKKKKKKSLGTARNQKQVQKKMGLHPTTKSRKRHTPPGTLLGGTEILQTERTKWERTGFGGHQGLQKLSISKG